METIDFCTHEEVSLLLKAAGRNPRHRALLLLLNDAGLRVSEARTMKWSAFDFRTKTLTVRSLKKRTDAKPRQVPLSERLLDALAELLKKEPPADRGAFVFPSKSRSGQPIGRSAVNNLINRLQAREPGIAGSSGRMYPHKLRHTFATNLRAQGAELADIRDLLGHENLNTSLIYAHADTAALRAKINAARPKPTVRERLMNLFFKRRQQRAINWVDFGSRDLVGREGEARRVTELVEKNVSVIITGAQGVGKTHLLDSLKFSRPVLEMDNAKDFKKSLAGVLLYLFNGDKEAAAALFYKDTKDAGGLVAQVNKETVPSMCKVLMSVCGPQEYILKVGEVDSITPSVVRALEELRNHFTIITTARSIKAANAGFIWNFERVELRPLSRPNTLKLTHYFTQDLEAESAEYLRNKVWDTTEGNPRQVQELCARFRKEPVLDNDTVADIAANYIGKQTREIDMSLALFLVFGALSLLRYFARESHNPSLRFVGGVAMVVLMFGRYFFNAARRRTY